MSTGGYTQSEQVWDPRLNSYVEQITYRDFDGSFTPPSSGVMEYSVTFEEAEARHTWRQYASGSFSDSGSATDAPGNGGVTVHGLCQVEPLITHPLFQQGTYALSDGDKAQIAQAETDATLWPQYALQTDSPALALYAQKRLKGTDSFLKSSVNVSVTTDEGSLPDLSGVGMIASPQGTIPHLPSGIDFLLSGVTADPVSAKVWRVTREYRGSGAGGWSSSLYSTSENFTGLTE